MSTVRASACCSLGWLHTRGCDSSCAICARGRIGRGGSGGKVAKRVNREWQRNGACSSELGPGMQCTRKRKPYTRQYPPGDDARGGCPLPGGRVASQKATTTRAPRHPLLRRVRGHRPRLFAVCRPSFVASRRRSITNRRGRFVSPAALPSLTSDRPRRSRRSHPVT